MISDNDIARRLHELAESAGPWADPLPEIRRRAGAPSSDEPSASSSAEPSSRVRQLRPSGLLPAAGDARRDRDARRDDQHDHRDDENDDAAGTGWDTTRTRPDRRRLGWKVPAAAAAAVLGITGIVGLAKLVPTSDSAKNGSSAASGKLSGGQVSREAAATVSAASAAAGSAAASSAGGASAAFTAALACSPSTRTDTALTLRVPPQVQAGARVTATVSVPARARLGGTDLEVYVVGARSTKVLGAVRGTRVDISAADFYAASGTLRRWSCADGEAPSHSSAQTRALAPGSYRLVPVVLPADGTAPVVGRPVPLRIVAPTK